MNGPDHYREAERLLEEAESRNEADSRALWYLELAKLHTAPAEVAATALNSDGREWIEVAGRRFSSLKPSYMRPGMRGSGFTERDYAVSVSTDSRQRQFSTQRDSVAGWSGCICFQSSRKSRPLARASKEGVLTNPVSYALQWADTG